MPLMGCLVASHVANITPCLSNNNAGWRAGFEQAARGMGIDSDLRHLNLGLGEEEEERVLLCAGKKSKCEKPVCAFSRQAGSE